MPLPLLEASLTCWNKSRFALITLSYERAKDDRNPHIVLKMFHLLL